VIAALAVGCEDPTAVTPDPAPSAATDDDTRTAICPGGECMAVP
jgi:hypothetical protein